MIKNKKKINKRIHGLKFTEINKILKENDILSIGILVLKVLNRIESIEINGTEISGTLDLIQQYME